jgi:hypothetical protein
MLVRHVALVVERSKVKPAEVARVAAALQKQVTRDFAPVWNVKATVDSFARLEDVPLGYWPVIIQDDVEDSAGYHDDEDGQPFALVEFDRDWPLTASHEVLEMLADPFGRRMMAGNSPDPKQGRVAFLVEVCDPSEDAEFGYTVNGILVSDFYTPEYFEPRKIAGKQYSYTGAIQGPREVLKGGYLSWKDPVTKHWFQLQRFTRKPKIVNLGAMNGTGSLRSWIDRQSAKGSRAARSTGGAAQLQMFKAVRLASERATSARATALRNQIKAVKKQAKSAAAERET